jgi:hypothetical protein
METQQQWLPPANGGGVAPPPPPPVATLPAPAWQPAPPVAPPALAAPWTTYCRACGNALNPHAAVCLQCGAAAAAATPLHPSMPKQKATGVVLAVFFGVFCWLYTYKRDAWKFWLNLGMTIVTIGIWGIVAWIWAIIDMAARPSSWYEQFPNGL